MGFKMSVMSTDLVWIRPLHGRLIIMRFWPSTLAAILPFLLAEGLPWRLRLSGILAPLRVKRVLIRWWWLHVKALILCYWVMKWLLFLRSTALKCSLISMNFKSTIDDMVIVASLTAQIRLRIDGTLCTNRVINVHVLVSGGQFLASLFIFFLHVKVGIGDWAWPVQVLRIVGKVAYALVLRSTTDRMYTALWVLKAMRQLILHDNHLLGELLVFPLEHLDLLG